MFIVYYVLSASLLSRNFPQGGVNLTQGSHTGEDRRAEARGPKGRERGVGLGRGQQPPPHQLGGLGSVVSSPSGVWGRALENFDFLHIWDPQNAK